ncbi:serine/threonine-protein kinase [Nonomuraea sp. H19]|uniref:serine/threonine-protein kinase n=1 Tax=Nonomuraea sp. H19 TaxID=3452206 RepID=UPI003F88C53A
MSDATPSLVANRYRLDELIGRGPMGELWRGYDTRADWVVAVKVLGAKAAGAATRERLRQHAQAVARVIHPNVAMVLDVGEHDGAPFLVMEHLTGLSLGEELAAHGPLPIVDVCDLAGQAAAGLDAAHQAGVVHGEVDADSFRRAASGVLKVVGFGMNDQEPARGDGRYLAPERAAGGKAEASGDLYALGCVCYELLCGRSPFEGRSPNAEPAAGAAFGGEPGTGGEPGADGVSRGEPAPPSTFRAEVPAELDRLVLAMIAEAPEKRPSSGEAVRRALAAIARPGTRPGANPAMPVTGIALRDSGLAAGPAGGGQSGPGPAGAAYGAAGAGAAYGGQPGGAGATAPHGATEVYQFGGPGGAGPRAGDTAIYQSGDLEPEPSPNRKLVLQLGVAVAAIVAVTVGMVLWGGSGQEPTVEATPAATVAAGPTQTVPTEPSTSTSPPTVARILPDTDPPASLSETAPPKATLGEGIPPGGWRTWLRRFDEAVTLQEGMQGLNPEVAAKARTKIRKAARKFQEGQIDATIDQIGDVYRDLAKAQQRGDMDRSGPLAEFIGAWRLPAV